MTLMDLLKLLKRHLLWVVVVPLVAAVACFAVMSISPREYSATVVMSVSGEAGGIGGLASQAAGQADGASVAASTNTTSKTVTFTATGSNAAKCINAANGAALATQEDAAAMYPNVVTQYTEVSSASDISSSSLMYAVVAFMGVLFVVVCVIVFIDMVRGPVHSEAEVEDLLGVPCLGRINDSEQAKTTNVTRLKTPSTARGNRAVADGSSLANLRFAMGDDARSVCVVPADENDSAAKACCVIATSAHQARIKTLVVNADFDRAVLDSMVPSDKLSASAGLAGVVEGFSTFAAAVIHASDCVDYLPAGTLMGSRDGLFASQVLAAVMAEAEKAYDLVVVCVPPALVRADASQVAHIADAAVLTVVPWKTSLAATEQTKRQLEIASRSPKGFYIVS